MTFADRGKIQFDVGAIQVISGYVSTDKAPNVAHAFPFSPEQTLWQWSEDRLEATGSYGRIQMIIQDASVRREALDTDTGLRGLFKREQAERYVATLETIIIAEDEGRTATATVRITRAHTFPEDMSLNQWDAARHRFLETVMQDFDAEAERAIRHNLSDFLAGNDA